MIDKFLQILLVLLVAMLAPRRGELGDGEFVELDGGKRIRIERRFPATPRQPGEPVYVLMGGLTAGIDSLAELRTEIGPGARTLAYDRGGIGRSTPSENGEPRDARQIAAELRQVLAKAGVEGPCVLVAHSIAGPYARVFAHEFPQQVRAIVLLDPLMEDEWSRVSAASREGDEAYFFRSLPLQVLRSLVARREAPTDAWHWLGAWREARGVYASLAQARGATLAASTRVVVVSAGVYSGASLDPATSARDLATVQELHGDLARSTGGLHVVIPEADHGSLLAAPHAARVAALIRAAGQDAESVH
jgi:pimeloyl-ACP methyl ester carboxylesterase